ncbi:hypothetical protein LEP1GSC074_1872 [Leptospira noguchii str. Hook]|uniref:Uncharacterized protein n=1 Tax=Leptospira noguchii serovar Autumnalis str. ZUN142 TaxID=1085540 RepID=M6U7S7_9LEPT|nr:hypothetical protein LEP1GSC186_4310 [Leptospira noguchii serovar Autumnalis str. ZUN142]EMS87992.1 hypothetical protein LEP1GSC074_1872 [Leptospira noguchii str. Hook]
MLKARFFNTIKTTSPARGKNQKNEKTNPNFFIERLKIQKMIHRNLNLLFYYFNTF